MFSLGKAAFEECSVPMPEHRWRDVLKEAVHDIDRERIREVDRTQLKEDAAAVDACQNKCLI